MCVDYFTDDNDVLTCTSPTETVLNQLDLEKTMCRPEWGWCSEEPFSAAAKDRQPWLNGTDQSGATTGVQTERFFAATFRGRVQVTGGAYDFRMEIGILDSATLHVRQEGTSIWTDVFDLDCEQGPLTGTAHLSPGSWEILVRYSDYGFTDCMNLKWSGPTFGLTPIDAYLQPISDCFDAPNALIDIKPHY